MSTSPILAHQNDWEGEFIYNRRNTILSELTCMPFDERTWNQLTDWEQVAWNGAAKELIEVHEQIAAGRRIGYGPVRAVASQHSEFDLECF